MMPDGNAFVVMSLPTAGRLEPVWRCPFGEEALPHTQQPRIDGQQDFIRKPMFEHRRVNVEVYHQRTIKQIRL